MITLSYLYEMKNGFVMFFCSLSPFEYLFAIKSRLMMTSENVGNKQKGRISKQVFQENKVSQIFWNRNISYLVISGGNKCSFFGKFDMLCFLETLVSRFALLPY